jgi:hypothetical protein
MRCQPVRPALNAQVEPGSGGVKPGRLLGWRDVLGRGIVRQVRWRPNYFREICRVLDSPLVPSGSPMHLPGTESACLVGGSIVRNLITDSDSSPQAFECADCDLIYPDECVKCKRTHRILKATDDPMASKELARWISGELRTPEQGFDALRDFVETQNIARFKALLETELLPHERKVLIQLLGEEEARHAETNKAKRKRA